MITHLILVEVVHLLLDGTVDARVACVQTDDEAAAVVKFFHKSKLLLQIHRSGTAYHSPWLGTISQFTRHKTACIKYQIGLLQHLTSAYGYQVGVARSGPNYLDMATVCQDCFVNGHGQGIVTTFLFV